MGNSRVDLGIRENAKTGMGKENSIFDTGRQAMMAARPAPGGNDHQESYKTLLYPEELEIHLKEKIFFILAGHIV